MKNKYPYWLRFTLAVLVFAAVVVVAAPAAFAAKSPTEPTQTVPGRRAALVIGNSAYSALPKLPNAANDAERVSEVLRQANFEVTVGENLDKRGLEAKVRAFLQTLNDGDVALFYYSGHAVQIAGENFILPVDAALKSAYDLEVEAYGVTSLLDYMRAASGLQILVLDACRDNPFQNQEYFLGDNKLNAGAKGLASIAPRQGALIVYSTAPNEAAFDGAGQVSPFADAFAEHVLSPNREVREVLTTIRNDVIEETGGRQVPWDVSSLTSQFYFVSTQNLLSLARNVTEVRVPPSQTRIELGIAPPIASGTMELTAFFEQLPKTGSLLLGDAAIVPGEPFDAEDIGRIVYVTESGQKAVELIPYVIRSDTGLTASGAVAVVFDPQAQPVEKPAIIAENDAVNLAEAIKVNMQSDIGSGFEAVPAIIRGAPDPAKWFRVHARPSATQIALDQTLLVVGDVVAADDLPKIKVRPALRPDDEQAEIVLRPIGEAPQSKPVVISVAAEINPCDNLAAEPLDLQAVTDGVLPNDIKIAEGLAACQEAVADHPDIGRFKFQYGRVLYADGRFDESVKMMEQAQAQGHVRAGQFLGRLYQIGSGVQLDPKKAPVLFETAANRGDPYGQYSLGKALIEGNGVKADVKRGVELLTRAAESGHTYALNQLGSEYLSGRHVKKDVERAHVMFQKSAGRGDVWGEVNLGLMYRDGLFVKKDPARAYELFAAANDKLHPYAATLMAMMDRDSGKDQASLLKLFRQSASRGDGWGAYYAAEMLTAKAAGEDEKSEGTRLYALAASQKAGKATSNSRTKLEALPPAAVVDEIRVYLTRAGVKDLSSGPRLSNGEKKAIQSLLGKEAPANPTDILIAMARRDWIESMPRLDML